MHVYCYFNEHNIDMRYCVVDLQMMECFVQVCLQGLMDVSSEFKFSHLSVHDIRSVDDLWQDYPHHSLLLWQRHIL